MSIKFLEKNIVPTKKLFQSSEFENILKCVHCGLCLDSCPTYRELDDEKDSPRGRLYLMRGLWEGELKLNSSVIEPLSRCLDCRACESACPSGVPYGELLEKTRGIIFENIPKGFTVKIFRTLIFKCLFRYTSLLIIVSRLIKIYNASGIPKLITKTFVRKILPRSFVFKHFLLPSFSGESFKHRYSEGGISPLFSGHKKGNFLRVGMFTGCIMDVSETSIHESTLAMLRYLDCEVVIPKKQICCGALHVHNGDRETAREFAKKNIFAFENGKLDLIITNSAGCGAQLKEYHHLFSEFTPQFEKKISSFERKTIDIMEFLSCYPEKLKKLEWCEDKDTVLYDAPCHLLHVQKVDKNLKEILKSLPGIKLIPIEESDWCCGSAGIYNFTQPEMSLSVLARKTRCIIKALKDNPNAKILLTGNPGCIYQLRAGISSNNIDLRVEHPVVYLADRLKIHGL